MKSWFLMVHQRAQDVSKSKQNSRKSFIRRSRQKVLKISKINARCEKFESRNKEITWWAQ
jgi:hypothetical protein